MVAEAFGLLRRYRGLVLYPIVLDLVALFTRFVTGQFGPTRVTLKFLLEPGLPSMLNLFDPASGGSGVLNFDGIDIGKAAPVLGLFVLVMFFVTAFVAAGFIGLLHEASSERPAGFDVFLAYGQRFWLRLLGMKLLTLLVSLAVGGVLLLLLRLPGLILGLALWAWLRITYIYWEFSVVVEDLPVIEAFQRAREHFEGRGPDTAEVIWAMVLANLGFGLLVNAVPAFVILALVAIAYGYFLTGLELALMGAFHRTRSTEVAA